MAFLSRLTTPLMFGAMRSTAEGSECACQAAGARLHVQIVSDSLVLPIQSGIRAPKHSCYVWLRKEHSLVPS